MRPLKKQLKAAFIVALLKLLLESASIGCLLYNRYQGIKIYLPPYISYRHVYSPPVYVSGYPYFYLASLLLSAVFISLFLKFIPHRWYNAKGSPLFFLKKPAEVKPPSILHAVNPIRMLPSLWKGRDPQAVAHLFLLQVLPCFIAFCALTIFRPRNWEVDRQSIFLQPWLLFPLASVLLLIRLLLLCKDLLFIIEEKPDKADGLDS